jgi:hypothetical protein
MLAHVQQQVEGTAGSRSLAGEWKKGDRLRLQQIPRQRQEYHHTFVVCNILSPTNLLQWCSVYVGWHAYVWYETGWPRQRSSTSNCATVCFAVGRPGQPKRVGAGHHRRRKGACAALACSCEEFGGAAPRRVRLWAAAGCVF